MVKLIKRTRLVDVARAAGVSPGVVSQVLGRGRGNSRASVATSVRIKKIAKELNYVPNPNAQRLRSARSHLYGILTASAGDPLVSFLVQHLDMEALKVGCRSLIRNTIGDTSLAPDQFDYHVQDLLLQSVDGVFCLVHEWFSGNRKNLLQHHPHTVFYDNPGIPGACYVTMDRVAAGQIAVRHLVERGRKRIGIALRNLTSPKQSARLKGYKQELSDSGMELDDSLIFYNPEYKNTIPLVDAMGEYWSFNMDIGKAVVKKLVLNAGADSIVATDDFWASAIIRGCRHYNIRVPEDVAVVGYLNHYLADWIDPPLTTLSRCPLTVAHEMVKMLENLIQKDKLPANQRAKFILPKLIVREST